MARGAVVVVLLVCGAMLLIRSPGATGDLAQTLGALLGGLSICAAVVAMRGRAR